MKRSEMEELESLRMEVRSLRTEVKTLREFVGVLYAMMNEEDGDYEADDGFRGGMEFGRTNT